MTATFPFVLAMSEPQRNKLARDSRKALRIAWPHRHTRRGRIVVGSNVAMLRTLRSIDSRAGAA